MGSSCTYTVRAHLLDAQLVAEKGDRPAAGPDPATSAHIYEAFGTGLDVSPDVPRHHHFVFCVCV